MKTHHNIFIHTPYSVYTLKQVSVRLTISQLKAKVELRNGIPKEHQLLQLGATSLDDKLLIEETEIKNGSVIRLFFATKIAEKLFRLANEDDFEGLVRTGVQGIPISEGHTTEEQHRLMDWNRNVNQRAFIAVCASCVSGNIQLLAKMLTYSAFDINQVTSYGRSALHIAAARGTIGCVCLLLDHGINPRIKDIDGKTAHDIAKDFDHIHCSKRIWLYKWNVKPLTNYDSKRHVEETKDDSVRFPVLNSSKRKSKINDFNEDDSDEEEENKTLPRVNSLNNMQHDSNRPCDSRLEEIKLEGERDVIPVDEISDKTTEMKHRIAAELNEQNGLKSGDSKTQGEIALLLNLAQKYGFKVVQSTEVDGDESNLDGKLFEKKQEKYDLHGDIKAGCLETEGTITGTENTSSVCRKDESKHEERKTEQHRGAKNVSDFLRRMSLVSKFKHEKKQMIVKPTEVYDIDKDREKLEGNKLGRVEKQSKGSQLDNKPDTKNDESPEFDDRESGRIDNNEKIQSEMNNNENMFREGKVEINLSRGRSTFEQWLERKAKQKAETALNNSNLKNEKEKRQDLCNQAFKRWLQLKQVRHRSASVSPQGVHREEKQRPKSGGVTFESWMKMKGKIQPRSFSLVTEKPKRVPMQRAYSCGLSYTEWIASKKRQLKDGSTDEQQSHENTNKPRLSGLSFENWVDSKSKKSQIDRVQKENEKLRIEYKRETEREAKMKNVRTFEEWLLEKKFEKRINNAKEKKETRKARKNKVKFEEDSKLIYNMWLLNKHVDEMQEEEKRLTELRAEWERRGQVNNDKASIARTKVKLQQ